MILTVTASPYLLITNDLDATIDIDEVNTMREDTQYFPGSGDLPLSTSCEDVWSAS